MKVALDATPLSVPTGGIPRYTKQLLEALQAEFPEDEFRLLWEQQGNIISRRWWSLGLPLHLLRHGYDVFHGTDFSVPYVPVRPSVLTLHDLSPWKNETWRAPSARVERRTPYLIRLGLPTMIVTPTEAIRREAISCFHLHPARVAAIPLAASPSLLPVQAPPPPRPYFLCLGVLEPRKNLPMLVEAWRTVRLEHGIDLVLAGRRRFDAPSISPEPGLTLAGSVADEELPALYSQAMALLFPSFYEGFGLPILEAMQCGCAVIASTAAALKEVAGGAAMHVDAADSAGWAAAMRAILESPALRHELRHAGLRRAGEFSWRRTARLTHELYEEAKRRF